MKRFSFCLFIALLLGCVLGICILGSSWQFTVQRPQAIYARDDMPVKNMTPNVILRSGETIYVSECVFDKSDAYLRVYFYPKGDRVAGYVFSPWQKYQRVWSWKRVELSSDHLMSTSRCWRMTWQFGQ